MPLPSLNRMSFIQSFGECDISLLRTACFMAMLLTKGTCKHVAPSPCHPGFHFSRPASFLAGFDYLSFGCSLKTHEEKEGRGRQCYTPRGTWLAVASVRMGTNSGQQLRLFPRGEVTRSPRGWQVVGEENGPWFRANLIQCPVAGTVGTGMRSLHVWRTNHRNTVPSLIFWLQER